MLNVDIYSTFESHSEYRAQNFIIIARVLLMPDPRKTRVLKPDKLEGTFQSEILSLEFFHTCKCTSFEL